MKTIECEKCNPEKQSNKEYLAAMLEAGYRDGDKPKVEIETVPISEQSNSEYLAAMLRAGYEAEQSSEPSEIETGEKPVMSDYLREMLEAGRHDDDSPVKPKHDKLDTKKWTDEQKKQACPRNNGRGYSRAQKKANIRKLWNGDTYVSPRYCNMCEGCYKHHAKELKEKMDYMDAKAAHDTKENGGGHWRKAIVEDDKEAKALKKKVSRNQESRHVEFAAEAPDHNEVWTYVDDNEPEPEKYGEAADPENIDFDSVYKRNRETGKKFSTGKAFRSPVSATNQDTIRIIIPEVVVDMVDADKAEKIMRETNYIKEANDAKDAQLAYADEFKYVLLELEKEGIKILAVDHAHYNIAPDRLLEEWNRKCKYWVSINAPLPLNSSDAKVDIANRLYYPDNKKEAHKEPLD
jgi:hypothetical protein